MVKEDMYAYMPTMGYFIKVYEGDKTFIGKQTKKNCWQRNQPTESYMYSDEIIKCGIITQKGCEDLIVSKSII